MSCLHNLLHFQFANIFCTFQVRIEPKICKTYNFSVIVYQAVDIITTVHSSAVIIVSRQLNWFPERAE